MPRSALSDHLQVYRFWLADITPLDSLSLPILNPLIGFSSITAPEITGDVLTIPEGNWAFPRKITTRANLSSITMKRGCTVYDRDFYNWMMHTLLGKSQSSVQGLINTGLDFISSGSINPSPRRNLLLIQYFPRNPVASLSGLSDAIRNMNSDPSISGNKAGYSTASFQSNQAEEIGVFGPKGIIDFIPARMFILYNCIPSRYKVSQDFDAKVSDVSIQELTLEYEMIEQVTMI